MAVVHSLACAQYDGSKNIANTCNQNIKSFIIVKCLDYILNLNL